MTALTEGTADGYRELMGPRGRVVCIPNAAPDTAAGGGRSPARGSSWRQGR